MQHPSQCKSLYRRLRYVLCEANWCYITFCVLHQCDQAVQLLAENPGLEGTYSPEYSQTEEQIRGLLERARELDSLRLTWRKCPDAPQPLARGSAVIDKTTHTAYFSDNVHIYAYEWLREKWSRLPECPQPNHTLTVVGGLLTTVGGGEVSSYASSGQYSNTLLSLVGEGHNMKWEKRLPPIPTERAWTAVVCSREHLVVIGGVGRGRRFVDTVEVMNTETHQWFTASNLPIPLSNATATVVGDSVYVFGGSDCLGVTRSALTCSLTALLQSCQLPPSQVPSLWHQVADVPSYRSTCVALIGQLVAVGGCDSDRKPTNAVYAYNPAPDLWITISRMSTPRRRCLAVHLPETD